MNVNNHKMRRCNTTPTLSQIQTFCWITKILFNFIGFYYEFHSNFFFFIAVGNKNDDPNQKVVITEDAQRFAKQMDIQLFETSAKDNINVEEMFLAITKKVLHHKLLSVQNEQDTTRINLKQKQPKKKSKCC